ncbi:MAG TPA: hypothetical protein GYA03_07220, partial [Tissierellia bacterium]|nr:hypothetical protein [Tissierellia bacterium]
MSLRKLCIYGLLAILFITVCKNVNLENSTDSPSKIFDNQGPVVNKLVNKEGMIIKDRYLPPEG